ncbi:hypothetical protein [Embleya sp. AB8]|uniref:hypothetical protein n=1 Tax=Embleya sp. AB8 TaxID=3156304 RepID=UPI003C790A78
MRKIVIRMGTAAIAGSLLLAGTACSRDEDKLADKDTASSTAAPKRPTAAATKPARAKSTAAAPTSTDPAAPGEPPPAVPPTDDSAAPAGGGAGSDPAAQARLDHALLTAAEMPQGTYDATPDDPTSGRETAQQPACQPLIDLLNPKQANPAPLASAQASVSKGDPNPTAFTAVELFAFTDAGARDLFAKGRAALKTCSSVTSVDADGTTGTDKYAEIPHAPLGDETLAVGVTIGAGGTAGVIVVRTGTTIVVVSNEDEASPTPSLPADPLVSRQLTKLTQP